MLVIVKNLRKGKSNLVNCSIAYVLNKSGYTLDIHCDCTGHTGYWPAAQIVV